MPLAVGHIRRIGDCTSSGRHGSEKLGGGKKLKLSDFVAATEVLNRKSTLSWVAPNTRPGMPCSNQAMNGCRMSELSNELQ